MTGVRCKIFQFPAFVEGPLQRCKVALWEGGRKTTRGMKDFDEAYIVSTPPPPSLWERMLSALALTQTPTCLPGFLVSSQGQYLRASTVG